MEAIIQTIGKVNGTEIQISVNGEKLVPVKPICEALGVAANKQIEKIKEDPILSSVGTLGVSTGKDGKSYEMFCLPLKYSLGWLFRIDSRNVKESAREAVLKYQILCYDVLYDYFAGYADYVETKQNKIETILKMREDASLHFRTAKDKLQAIEKNLKGARGVTYESYKASNGQFNIFGDDDSETEA